MYLSVEISSNGLFMSKQPGQAQGGIMGCYSRVSRLVNGKGEIQDKKMEGRGKTNLRSHTSQWEGT